MNNCSKIIYVESEAFEYPTTKRVLEHYNNATVIKINHYKDVFCRSRQDIAFQKHNQAIILAVKHSNFIYKGASVCQDFGINNFHYASCVMNCVCDCEYCYLKGMYPSGHICVFVNIEDYFAQIEKLLEHQSLYICATYDTDLIPLENTLGYVREWHNFAAKHPNLTVEIRTKCKTSIFDTLKPIQNMIFAFSLSPQKIIDEHERKTASLESRLKTISLAQTNGHTLRLCFDPIIKCSNWKNEYNNLMNRCSDFINFDLVRDVSIGSFRISQQYIKNMIKNYPASLIANYPYENIDGYCQYSPKIQRHMENFLLDRITQFIDRKKVFLWK